MRKHALLLSLLLVCLPAGSLLAGSDYYDYSYARMSYVKGDVFIQRAEDLGYEEGVVNLALIEGDKIGTRDGRTEIHLGKKNYLRINHDTQIDIVGLPDEYEYRAQLHLLSGEIFLRINYLERERDIEVHTPDGSYYILENGLYRFMVRDNRETELRVMSGSVEAAAEEGSLLVYAEESLRVAGGRFLNDPEPIRAVWDDSFYEWNQSRETLHSYRVDRHYLPNELYDYESELAYHGDWVHESSFGYVWVPRVRRSYWRPYWNGRWVWYPVIGWNWVSYEPWGWCVSHYGRWHWSVNLGWYWIPTRTWGPAWVHWHSGSHYVGWSPLSYWGYPGVIINNHYYGRYYHDSYPFNSRALTVVHKDQMQARHISRVALDKSRITNVNKISLSSRQPDIRPAVNSDRVRTKVAAQALERSKIRTVDKSFSGAGSSSIRSRVDSSRIRRSGDNSESSRVRRNEISPRDISSRSTGPESKISRVRTGKAERGRITRSRTNPEKSNRIKRYPSRQNSRVSRESRNIRKNATRGSSARSERGNRKTSGISPSVGIKRYPADSRTGGREGRTSAVSSRERRKPAASSRSRKYSSARSVLSRTRSSKYITGRSSSRSIKKSPFSSSRSSARRSSSYIRKRAPSRSSSIKPRSSSRSSSLSRRSSSRIHSRSSVSRSRSTPPRSVSRSSRTRSSSHARKSASRSSSGKKRKK